MAKHFDEPISAPDSNLECKSDEELVRGFLLALGAGAAGKERFRSTKTASAGSQISPDPRGCRVL